MSTLQEERARIEQQHSDYQTMMESCVAEKDTEL